MALGAFAEVARRADRAAPEAGLSHGLPGAGADRNSTGRFVAEGGEVGRVRDGCVPGILLLLAFVYHADRAGQAAEDSGVAGGVDSQRRVRDRGHHSAGTFGEAGGSRFTGG